MLLNTRPRVFWITLLRIAMLLQDGARAFAPPPQALQWRPAACAVSARGGQRGIGTLRAGDLKNGLPELQPTSFHAHQDEVKPAAHTRRFWRLMATVGAALALSVSTPAPAFAKGGGGASGGGGGHFHSRSYSRHDTRRASRSSDVGVFLDDADDGQATMMLMRMMKFVQMEMLHRNRCLSLCLQQLALLLFLTALTVLRRPELLHVPRGLSLQKASVARGSWPRPLSRVMRHKRVQQRASQDRTGPSM